MNMMMGSGNLRIKNEGDYFCPKCKNSETRRHVKYRQCVGCWRKYKLDKQNIYNAKKRAENAKKRFNKMIDQWNHEMSGKMLSVSLWVNV